MAQPRFTPELFSFLNDLADNNDRVWFQANKKRYDAAVKEPALDFIEAFRPHLEKLSPHFEANARAQGGSLFRINRDTRFSKDKTPYKTNTGLHFRHERARDAHAPGFYLHLEPGRSFMGVGLWRPEPRVANVIRGFIDDNRARWEKATTKAPLIDSFQLEGESLVRPPKGFDKDDPLIDDLKRKDFIAVTSLTQRQITKRSFIDDFGALCVDGGPFMHLLCDAVGVDY